MTKRILILVAMTALLFLLPACNDDDECPTCPDTGTPAPTMANIWPHADGTAWTFDGVYRESTVPTPVKDYGTEIPPMDDLHAALGEPLPGVVTMEEDGLYRFAFDGETTTLSGATGQKVVETMFAAPPEDGPDPLLALIARARPDLRPALAARYGIGTKDFSEVPGSPYFLGGYCFSAEEEGYFGYGDVDQNHSWVYLEGDLSVGSEFSLQLVPALTDGVWLYGRVWSLGDRTVNGIDYENVLEVMYVIDLGESMVTDEQGNLLGTSHPYMYGNSFFVPEVGPVEGTERRVFPTPDPVEKSVEGEYFEYVFDLVGVTFAE